MENQEKVALPLSPEQMRLFFDNKEKIFVIDYVNSQLKDNVFLTYLSNLNINCVIDFTGVESKEKLALIHNYMTSRHIVTSRSLSLAVLQVLFAKKGVSDFSFMDTPILSDAEVKEFIATNSEIVDSWILFLDSMLLYMMETFKELAEALQVKDSFEVIDDQRFIGLNVVNVFSVEGFFEHYFSLPIAQMKYFERQFNEHMFNGKNLFYYFQTEQNILLKLLTGLLNEEVTFEDLDAALLEDG